MGARCAAGVVVSFLKPASIMGCGDAVPDERKSGGANVPTIAGLKQAMQDPSASRALL